MGTRVHTSNENRKVGGNRLRELVYAVLLARTRIAWLWDDAGKQLGMQNRSDLRSPSRLEPFSMFHFSSDSRRFREYTGRAWHEKAQHLFY
jgi:hypothetical protein